MAEEAHHGTNHIPLEYDDETSNDADSALGDAGMSTHTQTLASSIYDYRVENGR